jgi:hypothetical protein
MAGAFRSTIARWWRRRRLGGAALALYAVLAVAVTGPYAPREVPSTPAHDLRNHVSGIIEARNALAEGQFPIRVAPHQNHDARYPIFQFYGNLPYTLGGATYLATGFNPYNIWKWEIGLFLVLGAFYTYRCARMLTGQALPAMAGGAVLLMAPYVLTDLHGRFAFCEVASFMLLPVVFYYCLRCFTSRRPGAILAGGISWSALLLSHNVGYLYAATFFGLFYLSWLAPRRKSLVRCLRVGAAFALGLALTAWSIIPQQQLVPELREGLLVRVINNNWMTPLGVLLAPAVTLGVHVPTIYIGEPEHFGLQVGWPILAGVGLSLRCLHRSGERNSFRTSTVLRLLVLFALGLFMVWSPFDLWSYLPPLFSFVQFSYRLLMFVVLWGSLLTAYALAYCWPGRLRAVHLAGIILGLGWTASPYLGPHHAGADPSINSEIAHPDMGRGGATGCYLLSGKCLAQTTLIHPDMNWAWSDSGGVLDAMEFHNAGRVRAYFPAPRPGDLLYLEGTVSGEVKDFVPLTISMDGKEIVRFDLTPGPFELRVPLPPVPDKDRVNITVESRPIIIPPPLPHRTPFLKQSWIPANLCMELGSPRPEMPKLVSAAAVRQEISHGHPTTLTLQDTGPVVLQLPVLYYPGMLRLEVDGQEVAAKNLGCFVAVELPPGEHIVAVSFVGVRWADIASVLAWLGVAVAAVWLTWRRYYRKLHKGVGPEETIAVLALRVVFGYSGRTNTETTEEMPLPQSVRH